ncbi:MAG TPA: hypothetical protein VMD99_07225 [Terriglobales bacterium]|nr:hypothetical protein [Terriglobales bacterium]
MTLPRTNSTSWPEPPAQSLPEDDRLGSRDSAVSAGVDPVRACLTLLGELEVSLENSQKALLARDVAGIERETGAQRRLQQALREVCTKLSTPGRTPSQPREASKLRAAQLRVLHLGRVQMTLLEKARRSLRVCAHLLAGPGANYSAPLSAAAWMMASEMTASRRKEI